MTTDPQTIAVVAVAGTVIISGFTNIVVEVIKDKFISKNGNSKNGYMTYQKHAEYCRENTKPVYETIARVEGKVDRLNEKLEMVVIDHEGRISRLGG